MSKRKFKIPIKIGEKFGRLTIIKEVKPYLLSNGKNSRKVLCKCDCGKEKEILYQGLKTGNTKSCGCFKKERITKHKMSTSRFYYVYNDIKNRCNNKNVLAYKNYGNRGIKNKWKNFIEFKNDMYKTYQEHCKKYGRKNTSIDRINNNENYCKKNCKWSTRKEQGNNKRNNHLLTYKNQTLTLMQWSKKLNINYNTLREREKRNWSIKKILLTKIIKKT